MGKEKSVGNVEIFPKLTNEFFFFFRTVNPVDAIYGIIKEMAGNVSSVK